MSHLVSTVLFIIKLHDYPRNEKANPFIFPSGFSLICPDGNGKY